MSSSSIAAADTDRFWVLTYKDPAGGGQAPDRQQRGSGANIGRGQGRTKVNRWLFFAPCCFFFAIDQNAKNDGRTRKLSL